MADKDIIKEYSTKEITIIWKPGKCIHAANCINTLPHVYRLDESPWIVLENASADELTD